LRKVVQNIAGDFLKILDHDRKDWFSFWQSYKRKHSPIVENYEKRLGLTPSSIEKALHQMTRPMLDKLASYWKSHSRDQKLWSSHVISHRHRLFNLSKEDFTVLISGLLGIRDWVVVQGNKENVILIDIVSLWKRQRIDSLSSAVFQAVAGFRRGITMGDMIGKQNVLDTLKEKLEPLFEQKNPEGIMKKVCQTLFEEVPHYDWVGFYLVSGENELTLGPYTGDPTEHVKIPFGKGICGQAASTGTTFLVEDVSKESNYLSCNPKVKSEIVVPIKKDGEVIGELDIDSHTLSAFDEIDKEFLRWICSKLSERIDIKACF